MTLPLYFVLVETTLIGKKSAQPDQRSWSPLGTIPHILISQCDNHRAELPAATIIMIGAIHALLEERKMV